MTQLQTDIIQYSIIIIGFIIWLFIASKNKTKYGINLKRVYCPVCITKQPVIRMPDSVEQGLNGGTTCPNCETRLDKYGDVIL